MSDQPLSLVEAIKLSGVADLGVIQVGSISVRGEGVPGGFVNVTFGIAEHQTWETWTLDEWKAFVAKADEASRKWVDDLRARIARWEAARS